RFLRRLLPRALSAHVEVTIGTEFLSSNHRYLLPSPASVLGTCMAMASAAPPIVERVSNENQIAGTDRRRLVSAAQKCAAMLVDAGPRSFKGALADHAVDSVALLVNGVAPPLVEHRIAIERFAEALVEMFDERLGGDVDAAKVARDFGDRNRVRARIVGDRLDVDAGSDQQERALVVDACFDQNAGDLLPAGEDVVRPLDAGVEGEDLAQIRGPD